MAHRPVPLIAVFATILILIGFVIFVLVYGDLRTRPWVPGMIGAFVTLIVAVVLFSIVYSTINVKNAALWGGVVGGSGAAIFYLLALPQIKPLFFPQHSVSGYVYFKRDKQDDPDQFTPVRGVVVEVSGYRPSPPTDENGRFAIADIYGDVETISFHYAEHTYPVKIRDYPDGRYTVIPRSQSEPIPTKKVLVNAWEKSNEHECALRSNQGYTEVKEFTFDHGLKKDGNELSRQAKILHLKLALSSGAGEITQAFIVAPDGGKNFTEQGDVPRRNVGWKWTAIEPSDVNVKVAVCVSRKQSDRQTATKDLESVYWYGVSR